jgi:hypothetical protein
VLQLLLGQPGIKNIQMADMGTDNSHVLAVYELCHTIVTNEEGMGELRPSIQIQAVRIRLEYGQLYVLQPVTIQRDCEMPAVTSLGAGTWMVAYRRANPRRFEGRIVECITD